MSYFAGIDYDSNGVYVVLVDEDDGAFYRWAHFRLEVVRGEDSFDRARRLRDLMPARAAWRDTGVLAVGVESTFSRAFKATAALARIQGAILACLPAELVVLPMPAGARSENYGWKALTVGRTNASKDEVKQWALANGLPAGFRQDLVDAFAIARATRELWTTRRLVAA